MRRLASWMTAVSASAGEPSGSPASKDSTVISEATSPACAPPMPSATTNSGRADEVVVLVALALAAQVGGVELFRDA